MDHPPALSEKNDPHAPDLRERTFLPELLKGLAITARHFFKNLLGTRDPNVHVLDRTGDSLVTTVQYPEEKVEYPPGYRGLHRLVPRADDLSKPRCVACYMCATICPAQCIYIEAGEYEGTDPSTASRVIEKFPKQFVIDELRCIVCGLCVDACPKDAIRMDSGVHTPSEYTRQDFVYDIPKLLRGAPASHPSDPWFKRGGSEQPHHVHKEAHTRIGEGLVQLKLPAGARVEVDRTHPVAITKFYK
ncbi:MAG: NADH-quinone oxidoreductase subunit I [Myxococcaceae bacterium]|nr:NADH-quinone oxidoreductase subunit I [Myxococcaceae bacterium]